MCAFLEQDSARIVGLCGPLRTARLSTACAPLAAALSVDVLLKTCARLPVPASRLQSTVPDGPSRLIDADVLASAVRKSATDLKLEPRLLQAVCHLASKKISCSNNSNHSNKFSSGTSGGSTCGGNMDAVLDQIFWLVATCADTGPMSVWARALHFYGLSAVMNRLERLSGRVPLQLPKPSDDGANRLFEAISNGSVGGLLCCLADGAPLNSDGPAILGNDPGCCRWNPLAAAACSAARRVSGTLNVALLLAARADANVLCSGPCCWTPLMHAASGGKAATDVCRLLVLAGADVRQRHATSGATALELGDRESARAIREARDERAKMVGVESSAGSKGICREQQAKEAVSTRAPGRSAITSQQRLALCAMGKDNGERLRRGRQTRAR